jgi:hypothetical protein
MIARDLERLIERRVFSYPSTDTLFNPYASEDGTADRPGAHRIRRANLRTYLRSFPVPPRILVIGEASGPWGCRFSGVPFTSELQLCTGRLPFDGRQSGSASDPWHECTAGIFWDVMAKYHPHCFIWNAVPLHPHPLGRPYSLRRPSLTEVRSFGDLLSDIVSLLEPECMIAIGRIAEQALRNIGAAPHYVRHPSHGGMKEFRIGIERIFDSTC